MSSGEERAAERAMDVLERLRREAQKASKGPSAARGGPAASTRGRWVPDADAARPLTAPHFFLRP